VRLLTHLNCEGVLYRVIGPLGADVESDLEGAAVPQGKTTGLVAGALCAVLAVAALPRFLHLFSHPTIPDEAFTFYVASHPFAEMLGMLRNGDFHPPLIYAIAHWLLGLSGKAYVFRIVPATFGLAGVLATFFLARRFVGTAGATLAALFVALSPILVFYDGYFRMYALLWSLCALSWLLLFRAFEQPAALGRWALYAAAAAALLYTHYLAFFTIAAQAGFWLATSPRQWRYLAALAVAGLAWLPWLPAFLVQFPNGGTAYAAVSLEPQSLLSLPPALLTDSIPGALEFSPWLGIFFWTCLAGGATACVLRREYRPLWLLLPLLLQLLYWFAAGKNLIAQRYLLQLVPALAILIACACAALASGRAKALAVLVALGVLALQTVGVADELFLSQYQPVDWNAYAAFLSSRSRPGDAFVFDQQAAYFTQYGALYLKGGTVFPVRNQQQAQVVAAKAAPLSRVWYVDYQSRLADPDHVIFRALRATHAKATTWRSAPAGYGDAVVTTLFER
jgi:uncharacterized membrane protein